MTTIQTSRPIAVNGDIGNNGLVSLQMLKSTISFQTQALLSLAQQHIEALLGPRVIFLCHCGPIGAQSYCVNIDYFAKYDICLACTWNHQTEQFTTIFDSVVNTLYYLIAGTSDDSVVIDVSNAGGDLCC